MTVRKFLHSYLVHKEDQNEKMAKLHVIHAERGKTSPRLITWKRLMDVTARDPALVKLIEQVGRGFPDSQHDLPSDIKEYHMFHNGLRVVDGVICYKTRLDIPKELRAEILLALHSAHQGVSGMNNRVEQAVFWPGLSEHVVKTRYTCKTCTRNTPSQAALPPKKPPSPDYPFQLIVGDYFSLQGFNYLILVDLYMGCPSSQQGRESLTLVKKPI